MRAVNLYHRINFFAKITSRDDYGATSDTWDYATPTISTRGGLTYRGGSKTLQNDEKFYTKIQELTVRYRSTITESMRIQIDGTLDLYAITNMEIIGRKEGLRLTIEKLDDGLTGVIVDPPTNFSAVADVVEFNEVALTWTNNDADDGVVIERSVDGSIWSQIKRINKATIPVVSYTDETAEELTLYYYRIRHFHYYDYSAYAAISSDTTVAEVIL